MASIRVTDDGDLVAAVPDSVIDESKRRSIAARVAFYSQPWYVRVWDRLHGNGPASGWAPVVYRQPGDEYESTTDGD